MTTTNILLLIWLAATLVNLWFTIRNHILISELKKQNGKLRADLDLLEQVSGLELSGVKCESKSNQPIKS